MAEPWHFEKLRLKSGLNMQVARAGVDAARPLVVMLHGFPECWYSWRHQISRARAAFRMRRARPAWLWRNRTRPVGIENYSLDKLIGDVADLIEACGRQRAIIIAHDLGRRDRVGDRATASRARRAAGRDELSASQEVQRQPAPQSASDAEELVHPVFPDSSIARGAHACARFRDAQADAARQRGCRSPPSATRTSALFARRFAIHTRSPRRSIIIVPLFRENVRNRHTPAWMDNKISAPTMVIWGEQDVALRKGADLRHEGAFRWPVRDSLCTGLRTLGAAGEAELVNDCLLKFLTLWGMSTIA